MRILIEHLLLALLEQFNRLFALPHQINNENVKVFIAVQHCHVVLVFAVDQPQSLVRVGQYIQDERGRILQVHLLVLAQFHHFVHQFPGLVEGALVGGALGVGDGVGERALQLREDREVFVLLDGTVATCHFEFTCKR